MFRNILSRLLDPAPPAPLTAEDAEVAIAAHLHRHHPGAGWLLARHLAARRAGQQVGDAPRRQAFDDVEHLAGAAIQVLAGFDVEDLHAPSPAASMARAASSTIAGVMSRRQVNLPPQVGRRRQGEHSRPSQITLPVGRPVF